MVASVAAAAPGARLAFVHPSSTSVQALQRGEVDVLVSGPEDETGNLVKRPLFEDDFLTAQRKGQPRGTGPLDLDTFCELKHLMVPTDGAGFSGLVDQALSRPGRERRLSVSIQSYGLVPVVLANSNCVCTLPRRFLAQFSREIDVVPPPLELPRPRLAVLWHRRSHNDGGHLWSRERLYDAVSVRAGFLSQTS